MTDHDADDATVVDGELVHSDPEPQPGGLAVPDEPAGHLGPLAQPGPVAPVEPSRTIPGTDVALIPSDGEVTRLAQMAQAFASANVVPAPLRNKPNDVFAVLYTARDLGVALTTALREFHVIDGRVTLSPKVRLAMVRQSGLGKVWPGEINASTATWFAERADTPGITYSSTYSWDNAQGAGMASGDCSPNDHSANCRSSDRNKGPKCKQNWRAYPSRMLSWRALGYLLDDAFSEIGTGLYSPDELGAITNDDGEPIEVSAVQPLDGLDQPRGRRGGQPAPVEQPADADTIAAIQADLGKLRPIPAANESITAWWTERQMPPVRSLSAGQARTVRARVDAMLREFADQIPEAPAENPAGSSPESAPTAPAAPETAESASAPDPAPQTAPETEPAPDEQPEQVDETDAQFHDGDPVDWIVERARRLNLPSIRSSFAAAGLACPPDEASARAEFARLECETVSVAVWEILAQTFVLIGDKIEQIESAETDTDPAEQVPDRHRLIGQIAQMPKAEIVNALRDAGESTTGSLDDLRARLLAVRLG